MSRKFLFFDTDSDRGGTGVGHLLDYILPPSKIKVPLHVLTHRLRHPPAHPTVVHCSVSLVLFVCGTQRCTPRSFPSSYTPVQLLQIRIIAATVVYSYLSAYQFLSFISAGMKSISARSFTQISGDELHRLCAAGSRSTCCQLRLHLRRDLNFCIAGRQNCFG